MCSKANNKTGALRRIRKFISVDKATLLYNAFILSVFNYCPIIWMFCSKGCDNLINKTQQRALRVVYRLPNSTLTELLEINNSSSIHLCNLRKLMYEVFKSLNQLNPVFMSELFILKPVPTKLRSQKLLILPEHKPSEKTRSKGADTHLYRSITIWNSLDPSLMEAKTLAEFKSGLKSWYGKGCICKICRT